MSKTNLDLITEAVEQRAENGFGPSDIVDKGNPYSVYNLVSKSVQEAIDALPGHLWLLTPHEVEKEYELTTVDRMLRHSFWLEYDLATSKNRPMSMEAVLRGVCSQSMFQKFIKSTPHRLAYMLKPPENYRVALEEILEIGVREIREILKAPLTYKGKHGQDIVDSKLAAVKLKTVEMVMNRLQGMPVSRSMQINENRNFNHNVEGGEPLPNFADVSDTRKLEKIVQALEGGAKDGGIIEVGFTDEQDEG